MALRPIVELGVAEAYKIATRDLRMHDLPPLQAFENEDWGRDYLLSRLQAVPEEVLQSLGLTTEDEPQGR